MITRLTKGNRDQPREVRVESPGQRPGDASHTKGLGPCSAFQR